MNDRISSQRDVAVNLVKLAMREVAESESDIHSGNGTKSFWWNNPLICSALFIGQSEGWIIRTSTTQVEWTEEGVREYNI